MNLTPSNGIRREMERAFVGRYDQYEESHDERFMEVALWAAKWMANRIADEFRERGTFSDSEIRQLAKELDEEGV